MAILRQQRPTCFDKLGTSYYRFNVEVQAELMSYTVTVLMREIVGGCAQTLWPFAKLKIMKFYSQRVCWLSAKIYAREISRYMIYPYLEFIVHTPCHYCEMVAAATGNKISKCLELVWRVASWRWGFNILVQTFLSRWFPVTPTCSHLGNVSSSVYSEYLLSTYSCGIGILLALL